MSTIERKRSGGMRTLDALLVTAGVVGGVLVVLWIFHFVVGTLLFAFKFAIFVVAVVVIVRLVHLMTRGRH